jgi:hypothetical protein
MLSKLAQINTMQDLESAVGFGVGIIMILSYAYGVILIIQGLLSERGDGSWKYTIAKGIALFASTGVVNLLFGHFFPGQTIPVSFTN